MTVERHPGSMSGLPDDQLATVAVSLVISELQWSPDVAPAVLDRISRDAVAYPEQFDRRVAMPAPRPSAQPIERSAKRTVGRLAVFGAILVIIVGLVAFAATASASAASLEGLRVEFEEVAAGFDQPVLVTHAGDGSDTLYVVEQTGRIWPLTSGERAQQPFLDLRDAIVTSYEQGLLGLAFHPSFADNGRFFVNYSRIGDGATVVSEFSATGDATDRDSERQLLVIEQPYANHNGGHLAFDAAGMLLIGTGDGGGGGDPLGAGQDPGTLLGKLLRIDVDAAEQPYGIPADNGFAGSEAHRPEIHALGLRNPWRFSVDPVGGHIYIGDVGQGRFEEVSVVPDGKGGQSFGWNQVEGPECYLDGCDLEVHTAPALSYGRDEGCTVIGGHVYRGSAQPDLEGVYVFGDYCTGAIWGAEAAAMVEGEAVSVPIARIDGTLVSFGVDQSGELYAVGQEGRILHVVTEAS